MKSDAEKALRNVVDEIDRYLGRLDGSSVADVRAGIRRWGKGSIRALSPQRLPANNRMAEALALLRADGEVALARALEEVDPYLRWVAYDYYPRSEIGEAFAKGHAFASLIGEKGSIVGTDYDLGLFLIEPGVLYRDHRHAAPELYAPLTGPHGWRFAPLEPLSWKPAHQPVWNDAYQHHATRVGDVPFLCIFGWTRDVNEIATVISSDDWVELEAMVPPAS